jgi:hypothetical protein
MKVNSLHNLADHALHELAAFLVERNRKTAESQRSQSSRREKRRYREGFYG